MFDNWRKSTSSLFPIRIIAKLKGHKVMKQKNKNQTQKPHKKGGNNKRWINNSKTTALEWTAAYATRGLKCILLVPNFALDSVVVKAHKLLSSHRGFLAMFYPREKNLIKQNKEKVSQLTDKIVRGKENLKLSHVGSSQRLASGTNLLKL